METYINLFVFMLYFLSIPLKLAVTSIKPTEVDIVCMHCV